jgi:hypothetical protein
MEEQFDKKIKTKRNILKGVGLLELIGGLTGIGMIIWLTIQGFEANSKVFLILFFVLVFYIYSIFAGVKLFKNQENAVLHSRILQYIQIFAISFGGITYLLTSGGNLFLGYNISTNSLNFDIGIFASEFQINISNSDQDSFVYLNLFAVILLNLVENSSKKIKLEIEKKENYLNAIKN